MNFALKYCLLFLGIPLLAIYTTNQQESVMPGNSSHSSSYSKNDNIPASENLFIQRHTSVPNTLTKKLKTIRENFKRINAITNWSKVDTTDPGNALEGSEAMLFYLNGKIEKISATYLGETYRQIDEYYLLNGELSFVYEKTYHYNRPIYYDSTAMKTTKDTEYFDFKKSTIIVYL